MSRPSSARKQLVWQRDKMRCFYCFKRCTERNVTVDHKTPQHLGGDNSMENLVTCCWSCNQKKAVREHKPVFVYNRVDNLLVMRYDKKVKDKKQYEKTNTETDQGSIPANPEPEREKEC